MKITEESELFKTAQIVMQSQMMAVKMAKELMATELLAFIARHESDHIPPDYQELVKDIRDFCHAKL